MKHRHVGPDTCVDGRRLATGMDMEDRNTKRDLVLAPSEYAYMQDVTKGIVKTYTGPTVINPTAQERPVVFDAGQEVVRAVHARRGGAADRDRARGLLR